MKCPECNEELKIETSYFWNKEKYYIGTCSKCKNNWIWKFLSKSKTNYEIERYFIG